MKNSPIHPADLIVYTDHLRFRIKFRNIPKVLPEKIYRESGERYVDAKTGHCIAVMPYKWHGKIREIAVSYDEKNKIAELITIHPIRNLQKLSRVKTGRWRKI